MSNENNKTTNSTNVTTEQLTAVLTQVVKTTVEETAKANGQVRKIPFSQYKPVSEFNPTGAKKRKLKRHLYVNGRRADIVKMTDKELELADKLVEGRFIEGIVNVQVVAGKDGDKDRVYLSYANRTHEQKLRNKGEFKNFEVLLNRCVNGDK